MEAQPKLLTIDEICRRVDRYADDWITGRAIPADPLLDASIEAQGLTIAEIIERCQRYEARFPKRST